MRAQPAVAPVAQVLLRVLAVHVVDPLTEVPQEAGRVEVLPDEVARVPVQPERRPVPNRVERLDRGPVVVGDLTGMDLVGKVHTLLVEHIHDRVPAIGEVPVTGFDDLLAYRGKHGHVLPDGRAGEAHHGVHTHPAGGVSGDLHLLRGTLAYPLWITVPPDPCGKDVLVPNVDRVIADGLAFEVVGDGPQ